MTDPASRRQSAAEAANDYASRKVFDLEDETARQLREQVKAAYEKALTDLISKFTTYTNGENWSASDPTFRQRTDALIDGLQKDMAALVDKLADQAIAAAVRAYQAGYYGSGWTLSNITRNETLGAIKLLPLEAIRDTVMQAYKGSTFIDRFNNARDEFILAVKKSIVESQVLGEGIAAATRRLRDEFGLTSDSPKSLLNRTETIARTEILRASNNAALDFYEKNNHLLKGWQWRATNDSRTCPICGALDGKIFEFGSGHPPPPEGSHPNCRCTALPVLKDESLEADIVGKRTSYAEWAKANGISPLDDGGILRPDRSI